VSTIHRAAGLRRCLKDAVSGAALLAGMLAASPAALAGDVTISSDLSAAWEVYGNSAPGDPAAFDPLASASDNRLTLEDGGVVNRVFGGYSDASDQDADGNSVALRGGIANNLVFGGYASSGGASSNTIVVSGGQSAAVIGGQAGYGNANANSVTISGGAVSTVTGGESFAFDANDNSVVITGGAVADSITVGLATYGSAIGNTLTISGAPVFGQDSSIYGGFGDIYGEHDVFTGNTFNLKTAGLTIGSLQNFEYLNFYLPTTLAAGDTMLTVTGSANLTSRTGSSSVVNVGINGDASPLVVGDAITLIHAETLITTAELNGTATGSGMLGVTLTYTFGLSATATDLIATVQSAGVREESKALSEGRLAALSLINQGADLAGGKGLANARTATAVDEGWTTFGALAGGRLRTQTGSHVDVDGLSLVAGLARRFGLTAGDATAGVFAEYGHGSYDSFNRFASGVVRGDGTGEVFGGGLLGRFDAAAVGAGHAYAEAVARLGSARASFDSADLVSGGVAAGYETRAVYASASAAIGYAWALGQATTLDVSGRYAWSRLDDDDVRLTTGETVEFDAVTSQRTRLGARVSHRLSGGWTPFAGVAWEREFDGKARATTNGFALGAPSARGDTGILEAGLTLTPSRDLPLSIDVGLQGLVGQREGVVGGVQAKWTF
jgi:hypothetical protein